MSIGLLRTFPLVIVAIGGLVASSAPVTAMAGVIEQLASVEQGQPTGEAINVDTVGVVSPEDLFEGSVIITFARTGTSFDFDISPATYNSVTSVEPLAVLGQRSPPNPHLPGTRAAVGPHGAGPVQNVVPARPDDESQHYTKHYTAPPIGSALPISSAAAPSAPNSYDQLQNGDVAPEFKAIYRIGSTAVDAVAPWTKPIYRTVDSAFQANMGARPPSTSAPTVSSFSDDDWFVSRFIKFLLSADSLPYVIVFLVMCIVVGGLLRLVRITVPTR